MVTWVTQEMLYNGDDDITNKLVPSLYPYTCLIRKSLDTFFAITKVMSYDKKCSKEL